MILVVPLKTPGVLNSLVTEAVNVLSLLNWKLYV